MTTSNPVQLPSGKWLYGGTLHQERPSRGRKKSKRLERAKEAVQETATGQRGLGRGYFYGGVRTLSERVRGSIQQWAGDLLLPEFGTLTLRTVHGELCGSESCDGTRRNRGSINCRVPGVPQTESMVSGFLKFTQRCLVVEEFGGTYGRRHFHYLADGASSIRRGQQYCFLCLAKLPHSAHGKGGTGVEFWKFAGGHVDHTNATNSRKAAEYVTKAFGYALKETTNDYGQQHAPAHANDEPGGQRQLGRIWGHGLGENAAPPDA